MEKERTLKNLLLVSGSNAFHMVANIILGLLLPVILTNDNYGYYKVYTLYIGYCGLLHFGFVDGIIFKFAGLEYSQLDKRVFRTYTRIFFWAELICSTITLVLGMFLFDNEYQAIAMFVGVYIVIYTMTLYYQYISQATSRFQELAVRKTISSAAIVVFVAVSIVLKNRGMWTNVLYWHVLIVLQCISLALLVWYVWTYRDITFGERLPYRKVYRDVVCLCRKGILLTISYEIAQLMLQLDRQYVSLFFPIETYAQYAFAYNILACITTLITAVSTVMFPILKRVDKQTAMKTLPQGNMLVAMIVCFSFAGSRIVEYMVALLLPDYLSAMVYFKTVFPALAMSSCITINMYTYYKVLDKVVVYLRKSLVTLIIAVILNTAAYAAYGTPLAISIASVGSMIIWYILIASNISCYCKMPWIKDFVYILVMMAVYYILMYRPMNIVTSCLMYILVYFCVTAFIYGNVIRKTLEK